MRLEIVTPRGPAWADVTPPDPAGVASLLVLGHGAGGGVNAPDLVAVRDTVIGAGVVVALVTQPYRVAGRRSPAPAAHLDEAWAAVLARLTGAGSGQGETVVPAGTPLVVGGRSSGARVACRTSGEVGAAGIVALAFPTHPPGRPERSRVDELRTGLPTLVVNGDRDPFGIPPELPGVDLVLRPGQAHDLRRDVAGTAGAVLEWLRSHSWAN